MNMACMGIPMLDKFLIGLTICSMAMIKAMNSPMVVAPLRLCHKAMKMTTANAAEAMNSLMGERAEEACAIFLLMRVIFWFTAVKRSSAF